MNYIFHILLAPTGALTVMMCYHIFYPYIHQPTISDFHSAIDAFTLSRIKSINVIDVNYRMLNAECQM